MKTVSILISNYNSWEAIQLCIESVRKYTKYPHKIIVYDDFSTNKVDRLYLDEVWKKGWIRPIFGFEHLGHGGAINELLAYCDTDLAMILDNDVEILESSWLGEMASLVKSDTLGIIGMEKDYNSAQPSLPDWFRSWFMMINMETYNDGMQADWKTGSGTAYGGKQLFYPVGGKLWLKQKFENPKGYKFIPIPSYIERKYHHFAHVSILGTLADNEPNLEALEKARDMKFKEVRESLARLRSQ